MKNPLLKKIAAVFAGFLASFTMMMVFELINSFFFPFPSGMNTKDIVQVRMFTQALPASFYILLIFGWFLGAVMGIYTIRKILKDSNQKTLLFLSQILLIILTLLVVFQNMAFSVPLSIDSITLLTFYLVYTIAKERFFNKE